MQYPDFKRHDRNSLRMYGYDYSSLGAYYITICAFERAHIFGTVQNGEMKLNWLGTIISDFWKTLPDRFPEIKLDAFVVMPNHLHAIIWVVNRKPMAAQSHVGAIHELPLHALKERERVRRRSMTIPMVIGYLKMNVTKRAHSIKRERYPVWQRNYYEHIIRNDGELWAMRRYFRNNPAQWTKDEYA